MIIYTKYLNFGIKIDEQSSLTDLLAIMNTQYVRENNFIDGIIKYFENGTEEYNSVLDGHLQELGFGQASADTDIEDMYLPDGKSILEIEYLYLAYEKFCAFELRLTFVRAYHKLQKEEDY